MLTSERPPSFMDFLSGVGNILDVPGASARNAIMSLSGKDADWTAPWRHPISGEGRVTGTDLLRRSGIISDEDSIGNSLAGMATEVATDPTSWFSPVKMMGGITALTGAAGLGMAAAKKAKGWKLLKNRTLPPGTTSQYLHRLLDSKKGIPDDVAIYKKEFDELLPVVEDVVDRRLGRMYGIPSSKVRELRPDERQAAIGYTWDRFPAHRKIPSAEWIPIMGRDLNRALDLVGIKQLPESVLKAVAGRQKGALQIMNDPEVIKQAENIAAKQYADVMENAQTASPGRMLSLREMPDVDEFANWLTAKYSALSPMDLRRINLEESPDAAHELASTILNRGALEDESPFSFPEDPQDVARSFYTAQHLANEGAKQAFESTRRRNKPGFLQAPRDVIDTASRIVDPRGSVADELGDDIIRQPVDVDFKPEAARAHPARVKEFQKLNKNPRLTTEEREQLRRKFADVLADNADLAPRVDVVVPHQLPLQDISTLLYRETPGYQPWTERYYAKNAADEELDKLRFIARELPELGGSSDVVKKLLENMHSDDPYKTALRDAGVRMKEILTQNPNISIRDLAAEFPPTSAGVESLLNQSRTLREAFKGSKRDSDKYKGLLPAIAKAIDKYGLSHSRAVGGYAVPTSKVPGLIEVGKADEDTIAKILRGLRNDPGDLEPLLRRYEIGPYESPMLPPDPGVDLRHYPYQQNEALVSKILGEQRPFNPPPELREFTEFNSLVPPRREPPPAVYSLLGPSGMSAVENAPYPTAGYPSEMSSIAGSFPVQPGTYSAMSSEIERLLRRSPPQFRDIPPEELAAIQAAFAGVPPRQQIAEQLLSPRQELTPEQITDLIYKLQEDPVWRGKNKMWEDFLRAHKYSDKYRRGM